MRTIHHFEKISDYLAAANIRLDQKMNDFMIYSYDQINEDASVTIEAYRNNYYEMTLDLTKGCSFKVDDFEFPLESKRLAIISPGRLQSTFEHTDVLEESKGYSLFFSPNFLNAHLNEIKLFNDYAFLNTGRSPAIHLDFKKLTEIRSLFDLIKYEHAEYGQKSREVIRALVRVLLEKVKSNYAHSDNTSVLSREQEIAAKFEILCNSRILEHTTVKEYADLLNISDKHLSAIIKKTTGKRALEIINSKRVAEAKSLLLQTNMTLTEIAFSLQFASTEYFISFFKNHAGTTPAKFRLFRS